MLTDTAGKILTANAATSRLLNVPIRALLGHVLAAHVAQSDRRSFRSNVLRAARGERLRFAFDVVPRSLQPLRVRTLVAPTDHGLAWVIREQAAFPARAGGESVPGPRLGEVLEGIRDGVVVVDFELCVRFVNRAARLCFAPHDGEVGEPLPDPWPTSLRRLLTELFEQDALSAEAIVRPDDRSMYSVTAYQSDEGESAVLLVSDITAEERRERAERDFIANAAHELQSPLTGISTAVEVLLAGAHRTEETRLRFLHHVAEANDRLSRLLQSLLLLAEVQSGRRGFRPEPVELRALLEELVAQVVDGDGPSVDVLCQEDLLVVTHAGLLEHALHNLVSNALRYGEGSHVIVSARGSSAGTIVIEISDLGPGLGAAERTQAFDRFYRAQARDGTGFGLGLSIVREAAHALGGEVELLPNAGRGLRARLTLPARQ